MGSSGSSQRRTNIKTETLSPAVQTTIRRIAYEHSMSYEQAKTHYRRMLAN